jgi:hypothetical protein
MREPERDLSLLPASSFERPWSERRDPYVRNVEAVGSNPITSTEIPVHRVESGSPASPKMFMSASSVFRGRKPGLNFQILKVQVAELGVCSAPVPTAIRRHQCL